MELSSDDSEWLNGNYCSFLLLFFIILPMNKLKLIYFVMFGFLKRLNPRTIPKNIFAALFSWKCLPTFQKSFTNPVIQALFQKGNIFHRMSQYSKLTTSFTIWLHSWLNGSSQFRQHKALTCSSMPARFFSSGSTGASRPPHLITSTCLQVDRKRRLKKQTVVFSFFLWCQTWYESCKSCTFVNRPELSIQMHAISVLSPFSTLNMARNDWRVTQRKTPTSSALLSTV